MKAFIRLWKYPEYNHTVLFLHFSLLFTPENGFCFKVVSKNVSFVCKLVNYEHDDILRFYTLTGQKYFLTKIFPYIFLIKPLIFITFSWMMSLYLVRCRTQVPTMDVWFLYIPYLISMKFSALNAEINIVSSSYNFQIILYLLSLKNWFKNKVSIFSPNLTIYHRVIGFRAIIDFQI